MPVAGVALPPVGGDVLWAFVGALSGQKRHGKWRKTKIKKSGNCQNSKSAGRRLADGTVGDLLAAVGWNHIGKRPSVFWDPRTGVGGSWG